MIHVKCLCPHREITSLVTKINKWITKIPLTSQPKNPIPKYLPIKAHIGHKRKHSFSHLELPLILSISSQYLKELSKLKDYQIFSFSFLGQNDTYLY